LLSNGTPCLLARPCRHAHFPGPRKERVHRTTHVASAVVANHRARKVCVQAHSAATEPRSRTVGLVFAHRIWERITLIATACGTLPSMCSLRLLEARCACARTFAVSHVSPGRQGERHICAGAHDEARNDAAGGGGRNQVLSDLCLRTKARTFEQARSSGDSGRITNWWLVRWMQVVQRLHSMCKSFLPGDSLLRSALQSPKQAEESSGAGAHHAGGIAWVEKSALKALVRALRGSRSIHICILSLINALEGPPNALLRLLTVQSLEVQFPPVSAMMFALTAMMYAICQPANAKSQFSSFSKCQLNRCAGHGARHASNYAPWRQHACHGRA